MIKKLRKLNKLLGLVGQSGYTISLSHSMPATISSLPEGTLKGGRFCDVIYERGELTLNFVAYDVEQVPEVAERNVNEFASLQVRTGNTVPRRTRAAFGVIDITEEFLDNANAQLLEKYRAVIKAKIVDDLVNSRLKDEGLV
jgi:hypothetical protein